MRLIQHDEDAALLRSVISNFPSGVVALAAEVGGETEVLVASSFSVGVSHQPPLVMFAVRNSSMTWPALSRAERIGVSVLGEAQLPVGRQLASAQRELRLLDVPTFVSEHGAVFLDQAPVWLECVIEDSHPAGDHSVVIMRVHRISSRADARPIVYHRSEFRMLA